MTKEELQARIEKKQADILKINKRIAKWSQGMNPEAIALCKAYGYSDYHTPEYEKARQDYNTYLDQHQKDPSVFAVDIYDNKGPNPDELMRAYRDLFEADNTVKKYQEASDKISNFDKEDKIPVLDEFLKNWKAAAKEWYTENVNDYIKLRADENKAWTAYHKDHPVKDDGEHSSWYNGYEEQCDWKRKYYSAITTLSKEIYERGRFNGKDKEPDWDYLEKTLEEERRHKYTDLVNRITGIVGVIQDLKGLSIGEKNGELNGIIIGDKGKARIETVGAGGYHVDEIVNIKHGQVFHYRVLIHEVK